MCGTRQFRFLAVTMKPSIVDRNQISCTRPPRPRYGGGGRLYLGPSGGGDLPRSSVDNYRAQTPLTCDECLHSILLSCATLPLPPVIGCIPMLVSGDLTDAFGWIQCLTGSQWLGALLCLKGVYEDCISPLLGRRKKRIWKEL